MHERLSYSGLQKLLHWLVALGVILLVILGFTINEFERQAQIDAALGPGSFNRLYDLHKEIGLTVLVLMLVRIAVRLRSGAPPYYPRIAPHERVISAIVHRAFYVLLVATPIAGWIAVSAYPALPVWFGLFKVPGLVAPDRALFDTVIAIHRPLGIIVAGLVLLHVGAALFHGLVKRDGVFSRMIR